MTDTRLRELLADPSLQGLALMPDSADPRYDESRSVWNGMVDHRPASVIRCMTEGDVAIGIRIARELGLDLGVKCGGHGILGLAVPDGGLLLDLRRMSSVTVDPTSRTATVQGGALLADLDKATHEFGLATTAGNVSHTGVGGYTLGGGMGWLGRRHGLASDNLLSCRLVTAAGDVLEVSEENHPDLFWALRGGGGNFGVVTEFTFALHEQASDVLSIECEFPAATAFDAMRRWRDLSREAPREAAFVAEVYAGVVLLGCVWTGSPESGRAFSKSFLEFDTPPDEVRLEPMSYLELQTREDESEGHSSRRYWKGFYIRDLSDAAIHAFLQHHHEFAGTIIAHGGAIDDRADDATAFSHRRIAFEYVGALEWSDPEEDEKWLTFGRQQSMAMAEHQCGTYVNTVQETGPEVLTASYSPDTLRRLTEIKAKWDPENLFRQNVNISGPQR